MSQPFVAGSLAALALSNIAYSLGGLPGSVQSGQGEESTVRIEEVLEPDDLPVCQCPPVPSCLDVRELLREARFEPLPERSSRVVEFLPAGLAGAALTSLASWGIETCRRRRGYGAEASGGEVAGFDSADGSGPQAEGWDIRVRGLRGGRGTLA